MSISKLRRVGMVMASWSRTLKSVWVVAMVVTVAVLESGTVCLALDMEEDATNEVVSNKVLDQACKETTHLCADNQFSGKWANNNQDMQEGVANLIISKAKDTTSDGMKYLSEKADAGSGSGSDCIPSESAEDVGVEFYNEANKMVKEAYNMVVENNFSAEAKAKYEAIKERASDAAGEVGAMMRH